MVSPITENIKSQMTNLNEDDLTEILHWAQYLLENVIESDPEDDLELNQETQAQLERFLRGDYKARDFDDVMKDLGLDE
ncbi:MAG: hypothetical protein K8L91_31345 [Anaerolineae bacterium]|nr:hypothetical protein [Anaerolineae bacterium]